MLKKLFIFSKYFSPDKISIFLTIIKNSFTQYHEKLRKIHLEHTFLIKLY